MLLTTPRHRLSPGKVRKVEIATGQHDGIVRLRIMELWDDEPNHVAEEQIMDLRTVGIWIMRLWDIK